MTSSFTTLWTNDTCRVLQRSGREGDDLTVLFGGVHASMPSYTLAGAQPGDLVYPLRMHRKTLWVLGCARIEEGRRDVGALDGVDPALGVPQGRKLLGDRHGWHDLRFSHVAEVLPTTPVAPLRFDRAIPGPLLERMTYVSRRGERRLKHVKDGEITSVVSLQGIYRLHADTANEIAALVARHDAENALRGSEPRVSALTSAGTRLADVSAWQIMTQLREIERGAIQHIILETGRNHHYMQVIRADAYDGTRAPHAIRVTDGYVVEYRDGSPERHFRADCPNLELARRVLTGWADGSSDWRDLVQWRPLDLRVES